MKLYDLNVSKDLNAVYIFVNNSVYVHTSSIYMYLGLVC